MLSLESSRLVAGLPNQFTKGVFYEQAAGEWSKGYCKGELEGTENLAMQLFISMLRKC